MPICPAAALSTTATLDTLNPPSLLRFPSVGNSDW